MHALEHQLEEAQRGYKREVENLIETARSVGCELIAMGEKPTWRNHRAEKAEELVSKPLLDLLHIVLEVILYDPCLTHPYRNLRDAYYRLPLALRKEVEVVLSTEAK